jgi:hypothetical protein
LRGQMKSFERSSGVHCTQKSGGKKHRYPI